MKAFVKYTAARAVLLVVTYIVLWALARLRWEDIATVDPFVLLAAILISAPIAFYGLRSLRDDVVRHIESRAQRMTRRVEEARRRDDLD